MASLAVVPTVGQEGNTHDVETHNSQQVSSRLRERLSEEAMLDLTKRLIAIPSGNPPGNHYEECAGTLFDELVRLGFDDVRREGACVLASVGTGARILYFSGHYDVVPVQSRDQFQPRVQGANLFGRGSSDMKSGLAAMIHAAAAARDEGLLTSGRIGIVLVPDEGTAGPRGSRDLNARGVLGKEGIGKITQSGAQLESMMVVFSVPAAKLTIGSKATRSIPRAR
jgi:succinyl-diaminopimelate desuccinylase